MTPNQTRAEQIPLYGEYTFKGRREETYRLIEQAIDDAVRYAIAQNNIVWNKTLNDCASDKHKEGTLAGLEMAAGIAESQPITEFGDLIDLRDLRDNISKNILAKAKELENGK